MTTAGYHSWIVPLSLPKTFPRRILRILRSLLVWALCGQYRQLLQWVWPQEGKPLVFDQRHQTILGCPGWNIDFQKREMPFQVSTKVIHHWMLLLICWFSLTLWFWLPLTEVRSYICQTKHLPGLTTFAACCSFPANDCISFLVTDFLPCQSHSSALTSCILCSGRDSCIATKSTFIPRISSSVVDPFIFLSARGTPRQWQSSMSILRSVPHCSIPGLPRMMYIVI